MTDYVGTLSTVMYSTRPLNVTNSQNVDSSLVGTITMFNPQPISQTNIDVAYSFHPPATGFSTDVLTILISVQEGLL